MSDDDDREGVPAEMAAVLFGARVRTPFCPWCGEPPRAVISGHTAFCATDGCSALMWDMTMTAQRLLLNIRQIELTRDDE